MKQLFGIFFYGMVGVGELYLALSAGGQAQLVWGIGTATAWSICGLLAMQWFTAEIVPRLDEHQVMQRHAAAITPDSELVEQMARLEPHQAEALLALQARITAVPGIAGATLEYDLGADQRVPAGFVREFIDGSGGASLKPIRAYSEGTKGREWAGILTNWFVSRGLARPAIGNAPATWTLSCDVAARWLMLVEE